MALGMTPDDRYISFEEYLTAERRSEFKHEWVDGQVYAMAGSTRRHARVTLQLGRKLAEAAQPHGCEAFVNDLVVRTRNGAFYPDVMVTCDPSDDDRVEHRPCLIVEVLSPTTERRDRNLKRDAYLELSSLTAYLLVNPNWPLIDVWLRGTDGWQMQSLGLGESIMLPCIDVELVVNDLYPDFAEDAGYEPPKVDVPESPTEG